MKNDPNEGIYYNTKAISLKSGKVVPVNTCCFITAGRGGTAQIRCAIVEGVDTESPAVTKSAFRIPQASLYKYFGEEWFYHVDEAMLIDMLGDGEVTSFRTDSGSLEIDGQDERGWPSIPRALGYV